MAKYVGFVRKFNDGRATVFPCGRNMFDLFFKGKYFNLFDEDVVNEFKVF